MKFIRDIIGEKRQMDAPVNRTPMARFAENEPTKLGNSHDASMAEFETGMFEDIERLPVARAHMPFDDNESTSDPCVNDEVAKFFAESDESDDCEAFSKKTESAAQKLQAPATSGPDRVTSAVIETIDDVAREQAPVPNRRTPDHRDLDEIGSSMNEVFREDGTTNEHEVAETDNSAQTEPLRTPDRFTQEQAAAGVSAASTPPKPEISAFPPRPVAATTHTQPVPASAADMPRRFEVPEPAVGRGASRHGRVKTRLLGFNPTMETDTDPMAENEQASAAPYTSFPVGWLIVVEGSGRGSAFTLFHGVSTIGRGESQTVRIDFGDNSISRENHASIAYDARQKGFFIGHGGKANIVRRNDRPVLSTEEMAAGDHITIGETTLRFVPFCSPDFSWEQVIEAGQDYARQD